MQSHAYFADIYGRGTSGEVIIEIFTALEAQDVQGAVREAIGWALTEPAATRLESSRFLRVRRGADVVDERPMADFSVA